MYPYVEIFGIQISLVVIGIIVSTIIFITTARILTKRNHQDFLKLFYWLPIRIVLSYLLGRYTTFVLETNNYFPFSLSEFLSLISPSNFNLNFVGLLIATRFSLAIFFSSIKRTENKKIRIDIFFFSFTNALIAFGIFLTLGDNVIGLPTNSIIGIRALSDNSALTKFDSVYPVGLFISLGALITHVIISIAGIIYKKNGLGIRGIIGLLIVFNICFLFQSYPRYGLISLLGSSFDIKQYISRLAIIYCIIIAIKRERKRFY